jgi:hypothetical protein
MGLKRWFIYVPEINTNTFVFFFYRGSTGRSWSVRDYASGFPVPRRANEFPWSADEVLLMAHREGCHAVSVEAHPTEDVAWYQGHIRRLNDQYLGGGLAMTIPAPPSEASLEPKFPIADLRDLLAHPKARKTGDLRGVYESPQSEDWVTWTVARLLERRPVAEWWPELVRVAMSVPEPPASVPSSDQYPRIDLWRPVRPPTAYEEASRARMGASKNPEWRARAEDPRPVEGRTEVDLVFDAPEYLIFVEAKLGSDISPRTNYDPERNQIVRNIDCVIEESGDRTPFFWMFVRDRAPKRLYSQLIDTYRSSPHELHRLLPHRDPSLLKEVAASIAVVTWRELLPLLPDIEETADASAELRRRI